MAKQPESSKKAVKEQISDFFKKAWGIITLPFYVVLRLVQRVAIGQKATAEADKKAEMDRWSHQHKIDLEKESKVIQQYMNSRLENSKENQELGDLAIKNIDVHRIDIGVKAAELGVILHLKDGTQFTMYYDKDKRPLEDLSGCPKDVLKYARKLFNECTYEPKGSESMSTKNGEKNRWDASAGQEEPEEFIPPDIFSSEEYQSADNPSEGPIEESGEAAGAASAPESPATEEVKETSDEDKQAQVELHDGINISAVTEGQAKDGKTMLSLTCSVKDENGVVSFDAERTKDGSAFVVKAPATALRPEQWESTLQQISQAFDNIAPNENWIGNKIQEVSSLVRKTSADSPQFVAMGKAMFVPEHGEKTTVHVSSVSAPDKAESFTTDAAPEIVSVRVAEAYAAVTIGATRNIGLNEAIPVVYPISGAEGQCIGNYNVLVCGDKNKNVAFQGDSALDPDFGTVRVISEGDLSSVKIGKLCKQFYPGHTDELSGQHEFEIAHKCEDATRIAMHVISDIRGCASDDHLVTNGLVFSKAVEGTNTVIKVQGMERGEKEFSVALGDLEDARAVKKLTALLEDKVKYTPQVGHIDERTAKLAETSHPSADER